MLSFKTVCPYRLCLLSPNNACMLLNTIFSHRFETCSKIIEVTTPELGEVLAMCHAASLSGDEGFDRLIVVCDCLTLIQRLQSVEIGVLFGGTISSC
jgi:hypothetical protein